MDFGSIIPLKFILIKMDKTDPKSIKILDDICNEYKRNKDVELELRFKSVTKELFESLYNNLLKSPQFTFNGIKYTMDVISENIFGATGKFGATKYIRRQTFEFNGATGRRDLKSVSYHQKYPIAKPYFVEDYIKYSVNLSKELDIDAFNSRDKAMVRFKNRISFIDESKQWVVDLTATKSSVINDVGPVIGDVLNSVFRASNAETFFNNLDLAHINQFEIEIEHLGENKHAFQAQQITAIAKSVFSLISAAYVMESAYRDEVHLIAEKILKNKSILSYFKSSFGLKQLLNQSKPLTRGEYREIYPPVGWYLTEKADGVRCAIHLTKGECKIIADKLFEFSAGASATSNSTSSKPTNQSVKQVAKPQEYIAEGELLYDAENRPSKILLFDVMIFDEENLIEKGFSYRVDFLEKMAEILNNFMAMAVSQQKTSTRVTVVAKQMVVLNELNLKEAVEKVYGGKYPYNIDGLIFTSPYDGYFDTISYKWKPPEHNTIDFLAVKAPQKFLGTKPFLTKKGYDLYLLFNGVQYDVQNRLGIRLIPQYSVIFPDIFYSISNKSVAPTIYYPMQFSPSANPLEYLYYHKTDSNSTDLNYKIIEMRKNPKCIDDQKLDFCDGFLGPWELVRVREDRKMEKNYFGNDFMVAEKNYQIYLNPLRLTDLSNPTSTYFMKTADDTYKAAHGFRRFVISMLTLEYAKNALRIVDFGAGRGADLRRYYEAGIKAGLFIDNDEEALAELLQRKFNIIKQKNRELSQASRSHRHDYGKTAKSDDDFNMTVNVLRANLNQKYTETLEQYARFDILPETVNVGVCNFAFHYFCESIDSLRNIINLVSKTLQIGGKFIMTTMHGGLVFDKLKLLPQGTAWELVENNTVKYAIKKLYPNENKEKLSIGQKIAVKLPMTDEMYEEPICNLELVIKEFEASGFRCEKLAPFSEKLELFQKENRQLYERLSEQDLEYGELFYYAIFIKEKANKKIK